MAQKGFIYEKNVSDFLKPIGLVPSNFKPAGAGHDQPDLMLLYDKDKQGCELKITDASAGSLVLKYTPDKKTPWGFGTIKKEDKEKLFISELADEVKLFNEINKVWSEIPYKVDRKYQNEKWQSTVGKLDKRARYKRDHSVFKELKGKISASKIEKYYNKKKTYYVNIGTHGFYMMGNKNPYKIKNVPTFASSAEAHWRARVQSKGGGSYQFTFEMGFTVKRKSPYNIGPINKGSVKINKKDVNLSCFPNL